MLYTKFDQLAPAARALMLSAEHDANQLADILNEDYPSTMPLPNIASGWLDNTYWRCIDALKESEKAYLAIETTADMDEYWEMVGSICVIEASDRLVEIADKHGHTIIRHPLRRNEQ